jgi:hypothetical protein
MRGGRPRTAPIRTVVAFERVGLTWARSLTNSHRAAPDYAVDED